MKENKPIHKFRAGQIHMSVWENEKKIDGALRKWFSLTIEKSYKDGDEWKNTSTFNSNDLGNIELLVRKVNETLNIN